MNVLDGLAGDLVAALGDVFRPGKLITTGQRDSDGQGGFIAQPGDSLDCLALVTEYDTYRRPADVPASDKLVMVLSGSLPPCISPQKGQTVRAADPMNCFVLADYQIIAVGTDPAAGAYILQAR